ncbi:MAG TPA: Mur ligase family protein [Ktedonobacteraceae bacterium]
MATQNTQTHKVLMPDIIWELVYSSYLSAAEHLHGLDSVTRNLAFSRELFALLQIDFQRWPRMTVTGSKGKGSTSALIASLLQASGERVGFISSPEMRRFNERIRINGQCVSDEALVAAAAKIAAAVRSIISRLTPPDYLGPGGVILALAATLFAEADVSALVVEAGRGGEYDEAKLVAADVSVLTPIMLEHVDKLGPTIQDIARSKTYITAPGSLIVTAPQTPAVQAVIDSVGASLAAKILSVSTEMRIDNVVHTLTGVNCDIQFAEHVYRNLHISLAGRHQTENAALAILAVHLLAQQRIKYTDEGIFQGLRRVHWPGRAQLLQQHPWVLLDGAINRESAANICEIMQNYPARRITAIVCVPRSKDLAGLCAQIAPVVGKIIVTKVAAPNLSWYEDAASIASRYSLDVEAMDSAEEAFKYAKNGIEPDEGVLLLGTQSFLGAALHYWDINTCTIWEPDLA